MPSDGATASAQRADAALFCWLIYDTDDQQTVVFTHDGMEYLREMLPEYKRNRSSPRS